MLSAGGTEVTRTPDPTHCLVFLGTEILGGWKRKKATGEWSDPELALTELCGLGMSFLLSGLSLLLWTTRAWEMISRLFQHWGGAKEAPPPPEAPHILRDWAFESQAEPQSLPPFPGSPRPRPLPAWLLGAGAALSTVAAAICLCEVHSSCSP